MGSLETRRELIGWPLVQRQIGVKSGPTPSWVGRKQGRKFDSQWDEGRKKVKERVKEGKRNTARLVESSDQYGWCTYLSSWRAIQCLPFSSSAAPFGHSPSFFYAVPPFPPLLPSLSLSHTHFPSSLSRFPIRPREICLSSTLITRKTRAALSTFIHFRFFCTDHLSIVRLVCR